MFPGKKVTILLTVLVGTITMLYTYSSTSTSVNMNLSMKSVGENNVKQILLWNSFFSAKDFTFGFGKEPFFTHKCTHTQCFVTNNKNRHAADNFDAIVFHGPQFYPKSNMSYPHPRVSKQLYVYLSLESPEIFPASTMHDDRFNTTITYRLDSDIHLPYFTFTDLDGNYVAPARSPKWETQTKDRKVLKPYDNIHARKSKTVAWFVSRCDSPNNRQEYVKKLQQYIDVDIYGKCGTMSCPRRNESECFELLKRDYFFYLSFENSNCVDYVTEKLYNAFTNDVVPVVLNGADMRTVSPPGSYLNAKGVEPSALAGNMKYLIENPEKYTEFFWWKTYYKIMWRKTPHFFCDLCQMLHNKTLKPKTYSRFTEWFHGKAENKMCDH